MGDIIGGVIGGIGSLLGGNQQQKADQTAAKQALTGYNYLTGSNGTQSFVNNGAQANNAASGLLAGNNPSAMANYLNSTGYKFQTQQGQNAITGSAASRGLLGSGATAKALTQFGTGLAGQNFNNYLGQLNAVGNQGLTAAGQIGQAGTVGGNNAGTATQAAGQAGANMIGGVGGALTGAAPAGAGSIASGIGNFLGGLL